MTAVTGGVGGAAKMLAGRPAAQKQQPPQNTTSPEAAGAGFEASPIPQPASNNVQASESVPTFNTQEEYDAWEAAQAFGQEDDIPAFDPPTAPPQQAAADASAGTPAPRGYFERAAQNIGGVVSAARRQHSLTMPANQGLDPVVPDYGPANMPQVDELTLANRWADNELKNKTENSTAIMGLRQADRSGQALIAEWKRKTQETSPRLQSFVARDSSPSSAGPAATAETDVVVQQDPVPVIVVPSSPTVTGAGVSKNRRQVDPAKDDLITAIAKLGGLNSDQAKTQWGATVADSFREMNTHATRKGGGGFVHAFKKGGKSLDDMRESLVEHEYLPESATVDDLYQGIASAMRGQHTYSRQYQPDHDVLFQQQEADRAIAMEEAGAGPDDFDGFPFDMTGIRDREKHRKALRRQLLNTKDGKAKAVIRRTLEQMKGKRDRSALAVADAINTIDHSGMDATQVELAVWDTLKNNPDFTKLVQSEASKRGMTTPRDLEHLKTTLRRA